MSKKYEMICFNLLMGKWDITPISGIFYMVPFCLATLINMQTLILHRNCKELQSVKHLAEILETWKKALNIRQS